MTIVRATEQYTAIEIQEALTWGTDPGSWAAAPVYRVPFRSEDLHMEDEFFPDPAEFGTLGGLSSIDSGRRVVRGTLVVEPVYSENWFWKLFGCCFGGEDLVVDRAVTDDTVAATNLNTHIFTPGPGIFSGTNQGLAMRVWKAGVGPAASGWVDTITGLLVTKWTWDQPEGDRSTLTIEFIGKAITTAAGSGTPKALETTLAKVKAIDLGRAGSKFMLGATLTQMNCTGFTITVDRKVEPPPAFLQSLTVLDQPGITGIREVTLDFTSNLELDYYANFKPFKEFLLQTESQFVCIYDAGVVATAATNYQIRFDMPAIRFLDVRNNITQAVPQLTGSARARVAAISTLTGGMSDFTTIPLSNGGATDVRVLVNVNQTDEPTNDTKFTLLANG